MQKFTFKVKEEQDKSRLDKFLTEEFSLLQDDISRSKIQKAIAQNLVSNQQKKTLSDPSHKVHQGEIIFAQLPKNPEQNLQAKEIPFEIIFEDDDLLVINKPHGLTVHPGAGNHDDTLVNALLFSHGKDSLSQVSGEFRPGIVHRLDKDTSGLMLVAKNDFTHQILGNDLQDRKIKRNYLAFIYGTLSPAKGRIDKNITRSRVNRLKMTCTARAASIGSKTRQAITNYETKEVFGNNASLIICKLETGRTHQIRVHMESLKHSLIGDQLYNSCRKNLREIDKKSAEFINEFPRQALHSFKIEFEHPRTKKEMSFEIGLTPDLQELYDVLKAEEIEKN